MIGDSHMDNGLGVNVPIAALALLTGVWATLTTLINPVLASLLVAVVCKGLDILCRHVIGAVLAERKLYWRREAQKLREQVRELERPPAEKG